MERAKHWEAVYTQKPKEKMSWSAEELPSSLAYIAQAGIQGGEGILDVGGGNSSLPGDLLERGYRDVTVLDIASSAIESARADLGDRCDSVHWLVGDVRSVELDASRYTLWHDRALFHFLTEASDQEAYLHQLRHALRPGGWLVMATFALDGPSSCSGLPVQRYDAVSLAKRLGSEFRMRASLEETHVTPWGSDQRFFLSLAQRIGA